MLRKTALIFSALALCAACAKPKVEDDDAMPPVERGAASQTDVEGEQSGGGEVSKADDREGAGADSEAVPEDDQAAPPAEESPPPQ